MSKKLALGLLLPLYSAFLLLGCAYLAHDEWPQDEPELAKVPALPIMAVNQQSAPNFAAIEHVQERKQVFFNFFQPLIEAENSRQLAMRSTFKALQKQHAQQPDGLGKNQLSLLQKLLETYKVKPQLTRQEQFQELALRIGPLPGALVMAQAATESAWGTSRFATQGNNFFGQWCFSQGCGMVPRARTAGASHEVATFASPGHSVRAYYENINTFDAYEYLRELRAEKLESEQALTASALLAGLARYSEKGEAYLVQLETIIRQNNLTDL